MVDPASAAVAFVGLAGSVAALAGIVVESCKTLNNLWHTLKDAPQDTLRLFKKLKRFETILLEIQRVGEDLTDQAFRDRYQQSWLDNVEDILEDFSILKTKIRKLEGSLNGKKSSRKHVCAQIRKVFSDEEIEKYENVLSGHLETFNMMLALISHNQTNVVLAETKLQSKVLSRLAHSAESFEISLQHALTQIDQWSQYPTENLHQRVSREIRNLPSNGCDEKQQRALSFLRGMPVNYDTLRLERPSAPKHHSSVLESHKPKLGLRQLETKREAYSCKGQGEEILQDLTNYHQSGHTQRMSWEKPKRCVLGRLLIHNLPIGILSVRVTERVTRQTEPRKGPSDWSYAVEFSLFPQSWLASRVITLSMTASSAFGDAPSFNWNLKQAHYNSSPRLASYLQNADIPGLQRLFMDGEARPTDLLAPWGHSLLHMCIIYYAAGNTESLEVCRFLLGQGADPNVRSANGSLMVKTRNLEPGLQSLASVLIQADADLTVYNSEGHSACSLVFSSQHGVSYLESFVYRYIDLYTLEEMTSVDAWILAALARSFPTFRKCMESHLASYRSPMDLSNSCDTKKLTSPQFDEEHQVAEVKRASVKVRTGFLRALCARGTVSMLKPFLSGDIDLDEFEGPHPTTYIRAAASQGNTDVVLALMDAGASVTVKALGPEYGHWEPPEYRALSPVDDFLDRWRSLRERRTQYTGNPENEHWILKRLLQNPTFCERTVLFWALWTSSPPMIIKTLLDAGCGRRDNTAVASWCQKVYGSEVIEAVKWQHQLLPLLLEYGLAKECEDCFRFTALLHALDGGQQTRECAKVLIDAGADVVRRTGSGFTPLELVKRNIHIKHPRWPMASRTPGTYTGQLAINRNQFHPVTLEEDQQAHDLLQIALRQQEKTSTRRWLQGMISLFQFLIQKAAINVV